MNRVDLEPPTLERAGEFVAAVRRSRRLHRNRVTPPSTAAAYAAYVTRLDNVRVAGFLVIESRSGDIAGVVNINEIVRGYFQSAYLGYYAFTPLAGKGLMRAGLSRVVDRAFADLKLHRLEANVQPDNERSIALVRVLGFRLEGVSPKYLKISGRWRDHQRWAILSDEWRLRKPSIGTPR